MERSSPSLAHTTTSRIKYTVLSKAIQYIVCGLILFNRKSVIFFFYYFAEGSNFLKRGSTYPPSFPMFHSPRVENGVRRTQMSDNFSWKFQALILLSCASVIVWKTVEPFFGFGCLYCKLLGHVDGATLPSAFSSVVLDLKLANGCSTADHK